MAPSRERGGGPAPGQQRPQGQAAGGRGGGRGPHSGGRGPNPNSAAAKKVHDNGSAPEKAPQPQQQSQGGSSSAAEPAKPSGGWGSGPSFKDKLMAPKQEPVPAPPPAAAAPAKDSAAKPAANGPDAAKQPAPEAAPAPSAAQPAAPRPYAAAVTSPVSAGGAPADSSSGIQFGTFTDGDVAQSKEQPAAPQGPLPTAVPAAVEAVRHQSRQAPTGTVPVASVGGAVGGGGAGGPAPAAAQPVNPPPPKAAPAPPTPPARKMLKIVDPNSHMEINLAGSTAAAGGDAKSAEGAGPAGAKPAAPAGVPTPPPKKVLTIKEPTAKPKPPPEPKPAEAPKPAEPAAKPAEAPKPAEPAAKPAEAPKPAEPAAKLAAEAKPAEAAPAPKPEPAAAPEAAAPAAAEATPAAASPEKAPEVAAPAAAPHKEPASFQIDVAEEEEAEEPKAPAAPAAAEPTAAPAASTEAAAPAAPAPAPAAAAPAEEAAASASGSGDDSSAPSATGAGGRKKNLKQALREADAKGANNDMLSAFREPQPAPKPEPVEAVKPKEAPEEAKPAAAPVPVEEVTEHWEERADEAATQEAASASTPAGDGDTHRRYSRDYLLALGSRIVIPLVPPLDSYHLPVLGLPEPQDNTRIGVGMTLGRAGSREMDWGGRRDDRGGRGDFRGGDMRGDRAGGAMGMDRRDRDGMRGGPGRGGPGGGMDRRGSANMDDGWQRRGPPPPPSPGGDMRGGRDGRGMSRQGSGSGGYGGPVNLHKSDNRWQVGVSIAEDPEEDKKQKTFKGILNKLTPDNYDKLKQQILQVPITHQKTLEGFINQIFDKALIETTFSEMYANLCKEIHPSLPQFPSNDPNNQKPVDFRRLLLNKCQQEFEDGVAAMKKVKEREEHSKEEAEKEKQQGKEKEKAAAGPENGKPLEEGEIPAPLATAPSTSTDDARAKALADAAEAERELKARRRMLGNIQFIGHLYKCGLLTERIIHSCIVQLLNDETSPRPDDIECLCKLLTTLGKQLEEQATRKGPANGNALDVYFSRMARLRAASNLDSRIKFAIQDVLDLRAAKWVSRRKVEGPKRIEDVHREAQLQLAAQASRDREERYGQRGPGGRGGPMGGRDAPPPPGRFGGPAPQDEARLMGRGEVARPLRGAAMERQGSAEVSLRPSSFLTGKRTGSPAQPGGVVAAAAASAREAAAAAVRQAPSAPPPPQPREERPVPPPPAGMSEEAAKKKGALWVKELYEIKEKVAAADSLQGLKAAGAPMGAVLAAATREAFEVRGIDPAARLDLLKEVLVEQLTSTEGVLNSSMLEDAFGRFMGELDTWIEDNPKAAGVAAKAVGELAAQGHLGLGPCLRPILEAKGGAGGDDDEGGASDMPPLVESGVAGRDILENVLQAAVAAGGADKAAELWRASGLEAAKFYDMPEDVEELAGKYPFVSS